MKPQTSPQAPVTNAREGGHDSLFWLGPSSTRWGGGDGNAPFGCWFIFGVLGLCPHVGVLWAVISRQAFGGLCTFW